MNKQQIKKQWTVKALSEAAGVTPGYIRRLLLDGRIQGHKLSERLWVVPYEEGCRWLESRERE
jgi:hypothetical protein